jgi:hypothetical protein
MPRSIRNRCSLSAVTLASVAGHVKPLFARFRGGRGFGTAVGAVSARVPMVFPVCLLVFFITLGFTGYVSVCAAAAAAALPLTYYVLSRLTVPRSTRLSSVSLSSPSPPPSSGCAESLCATSGERRNSLRRRWCSGKSGTEHGIGPIYC